MDGYDIITKYFEEWLKTQEYRDMYYVAFFDARKNSHENYYHYNELFELTFDGDIIFDMDWCEGETDIINLRFYSLDEILAIIEDIEVRGFNTSRKWFNVRR